MGDARIAAAADHLDDQIQDDRRILVLVVVLADEIQKRFRQVERLLVVQCVVQLFVKHADRKVVFDKRQDDGVVFQRHEHVVDNKNDAILEIADVVFLQRRFGVFKKLGYLASNEMVAQHIFVFEIQIKGSFRDAGFGDDVLNADVFQVVVGKKGIGGVDETLFFYAFVFQDFRFHGLTIP